MTDDAVEMMEEMAEKVETAMERYRLMMWAGYYLE